MSSHENARYTDRLRSPSAFDRCIVRLLQTIFHFVSLVLGETISTYTAVYTVVLASSKCTGSAVRADNQFRTSTVDWVHYELDYVYYELTVI